MYASDERQAGYVLGGVFSGVGISGGISPAPVREPEVRAALDRLSRQVDGVGDALSLVEDRLERSVARGKVPVTDQAQLKGGMQTGMGMAIDGMADRLEIFERRIRDLLDRLEV